MEGHQLKMTPSIGIALHPRDGNVAGDLIKKADKEMYDAKEKGKNNDQFYNNLEMGRVPNV